MVTYIVTLQAKDTNGTRVLRLALKMLLRRFGLKAVKVEEHSQK